VFRTAYLSQERVYDLANFWDSVQASGNQFHQTLELRSCDELAETNMVRTRTSRLAPTPSLYRIGRRTRAAPAYKSIASGLSSFSRALGGSWESPDGKGIDAAPS